MKIQRTATAVWEGSGKEGAGRLDAPGGVLSGTPYSAGMRFEGQPGTNPEELIAAAHAGCFSMALSFGLSGAGHPPEKLSTAADLTMVKEEAGWTISTIKLTVEGRVPGIDAAAFQQHAEKAKAGCPVSRALAGVDIQLEAKLAEAG
ncbi:MAG TPA: OsmC family protein [Thermoanaerobaculia bacterium]|nr:OsmC family protein [Thermoanaerobaculia bacterium]